VVSMMGTNAACCVNLKIILLFEYTIYKYDYHHHYSGAVVFHSRVMTSLSTLSISVSDKIEAV